MTESTPVLVHWIPPWVRASIRSLDRVFDEIQSIQSAARADTSTRRPTWPMIILKTPKGWTGPKEVDGLKTEGFWRSHQVPFSDMSNPALNSINARRAVERVISFVSPSN